MFPYFTADYWYRTWSQSSECHAEWCGRFIFVTTSTSTTITNLGHSFPGQRFWLYRWFPVRHNEASHCPHQQRTSQSHVLLVPLLFICVLLSVVHCQVEEVMKAHRMQSYWINFNNEAFMTICSILPGKWPECIRSSLFPALKKAAMWIPPSVLSRPNPSESPFHWLNPK